MLNVIQAPLGDAAAGRTHSHCECTCVDVQSVLCLCNLDECLSYFQVCENMQDAGGFELKVRQDEFPHSCQIRDSLCRN